MDRCDGRSGLFGRCHKQSLHPGDHDNGKKTWPRLGSDLQIYRLALAELDRLRAEQRRLAAIAQRHEQTRPFGIEHTDCDHVFGNSIEFGEIKWRGQDDPYRYREFWHVETCKKCGLTKREADEYYGDDMATIHVTWRR